MDPTHSRIARDQSSNAVWVGEPQNPDVYPKRYRAFVKDGIQITVNSFVLVLPVVGLHHIGYIKDLYENKDGSKKAKLRWLDRHIEVKNSYPGLDQISEEIYLSPDIRVINVDTIDSICTVLTPDDYNRCLDFKDTFFTPLSDCGIYMCCKEIAHRAIKHFDLSRLPGYSNQNIFSLFRSLSSTLPCGNPSSDLPCGNPSSDFPCGNPSSDLPCGNPSTKQSSDLPCGNPSTQFPRRPRSDMRKKLKIVPSGDSEEQIGNSAASCSNSGKEIIIENGQMPPKLKYKLMHLVGREHDGSGPLEVLYEVLSPQFPGRWLRCEILVKTSTTITVKYRDSEAGGRLVEEELPYGVAPPERLGMRLAGRTTFRPSPPLETSNNSFQLGESVDVWLNKSWCEGVFISPADISTPDQFLVYLLGDNILEAFHIKDIRVSKDWVDEKWMEIPRQPDILPVISSMLVGGANANPPA